MITAGQARPQTIMRDSGAYVDGIYVANYSNVIIWAIVQKINDNYLNRIMTEEGQISDRPRLKMFTNETLFFQSDDKQADKLVWGGYIWNLTGMEMFEHNIRGGFHKEYEFTRTDLTYESAMNWGGSS